MKTILGPDGLVSRLLGTPGKDRPSLRMTSHCVKARCEDGILLYNTLTGEMLLLSEDELSSLSARKEFDARHFLVPKDLDENSLADNIRQVVRTVRSRGKHTTGYTILTTTDCNARCFYCYEQGMRRVTMTPETAEFAARHISASCGGEKISLNWFGGEPLLGKDIISLICGHLSAGGVDFTSTITTNGYLFDAQTAFEAAYNWHLKSAQITLDGTREVYNRTKAYVYGNDPDPFARVLENIDRLLENRVAVRIRLNYNRDNFDNLMSLADFLGERYGGRDDLFVYPVAIRDFAGDPDKTGGWKDEANAYHALKDKLNGYGIARKDVLRPGIATVRCMADNPECEVIHPDGKVAKCEHFDEGLVIGNVFSPERDSGIMNAWKERVFFGNCGKCPLRPMCINLKMCPWSKFGCTPATQALRIRELQEKMLNCYAEHKNGAMSPEKE